MKRFPQAIITCVLLALGACDVQEEDEPMARVDALIDSAVDELNLQAEIYCDCWDEFGFESRSECNNNSAYVGPSQLRCIKDAYAQDHEVAQDFLECLVPLEREYTACVNDRLECGDYESDDRCVDDYYVGRDTCIGLPPTITRDLEACFE